MILGFFALILLSSMLISKRKSLSLKPFSNRSFLTNSVEMDMLRQNVLDSGTGFLFAASAASSAFACFSIRSFCASASPVA